MAITSIVIIGLIVVMVCVIVFGGILYQKVAIGNGPLRVDKGKESKVYVFVQQSQSHSRRQLGVIH